MLHPSVAMPRGCLYFCTPYLILQAQEHEHRSVSCMVEASVRGQLVPAGSSSSPVYSQGRYLAVQAFSTGRQELPELSTRHQGVSRLLLRMRSVLFSWLRTQLFVSTVLRMCRSIQDCACVHISSHGTACTLKSRSIDVSGMHSATAERHKQCHFRQIECCQSLCSMLYYPCCAESCLIQRHLGMSQV